jgi:hypothetical protein
MMRSPKRSTTPVTHEFLRELGFKLARFPNGPS